MAAKQLETESIYSSVFDVMVDGKAEHVVLKAVQRHPYKPIIMHMDLQRVSAKDILVKSIPVHFLNEQESKGVKAGGIVNHNLTQVEVRCQANQLPEFIELDLKNVGLNEVVHLSDLTLPKGVKLSVDISNGEHDLPVLSIHAPKGSNADAETGTEAEEETAE
jgi:large subunit ribosomal protein L25